VRRVRLASGIELHYIERGRGEPVILAHGGSGDLHSWQAQMHEFARGYRVVSYSRRYNYPNRNRSAVRDYSARDDAEDLAALLARLGVERARLVGTSYGAFAALALAIERPGLVQSLVLAEPPVHRLATREIYERFLGEVWAPARRAFRQGCARRAMRTLADGMWGRAVFADLPGPSRRLMMRNARAMEALVMSSDPFPELPRRKLRRLRIPVLLIHGAHAATIHRVVNRSLARLLPCATQRIIAKASHGSPRENPRAFNRVVLDFLKEN
jgi:pimeloyl-ACP methyl ester carboxylesterase